MDKRLLTIVQHTENGKGVCDVGTDHGFIPIYLAKNGYPGNLIATDINYAPLMAGMENAKEAGFADRIEFLLCDGLEKCPQERIDTVIIAGMGGDTICGILDRADWLSNHPFKLILQPMTKAEILRYWLINNGFEIKTEELSKDMGNFYQIFTAMSGTAAKYSDAELFTGKYERIKTSEFFPERLDKLINNYVRSIEGMKSSDKPNIILKRELNRKILGELEEMKEKLRGEKL